MSAAAAPLLEAEGLTLRFGAIPALEEVALAIWPGEVVAIVGESGSGKTTLLRVLSGLMRLQPALGHQAPAIAGDQARKGELRHRGRQVVADRGGVGKELVRRFDADQVSRGIVGPGGTITRAKKAGQRVGGTGAERFAEHVKFGRSLEAPLHVQLRSPLPTICRTSLTLVLIWSSE